MQNVQIEPVGNGYFLTIKNEVAPDVIFNKWAVTEIELLDLQKILNDMFPG